MFRTKSTLSVDHELLRNMIVSGEVKYTNNDYVGIDRKDKEPGLKLAVDYKLFRNLYSEFSYNYAGRNSTAANADYRQHIFKIQFSVQL